MVDYLLLLHQNMNKKIIKIPIVRMKKTLLLATLVALAFVQCKKKDDPFLIKEGAIGKLSSETRVKQLDSIFAMDSIVKTSASPNALETQGEVEIYEKGGKRLLFLSPKDYNDPNSTISDVLIYDVRYKTEKGLTADNTFKDFKDNYKIKHIERIINGAMIFFEDTDIYLTIDAKYLTPEAKNNTEEKLEATDIVDNARIKYFRLDWDK